MDCSKPDRAWEKDESQSCWNACGEKGGACSSCKIGSSINSQEGFCCNRNGSHSDKDKDGFCPEEALAQLTSNDYVCVTQKTAVPPNPTYIGCYRDSYEGIFTHFNEQKNDGIDAEYCLSYCHNADYKFAGLKNGNECYCGNEDPSTLGMTADESACDIPCSKYGRSADEICGGISSMNVFSSQYEMENLPEPEKYMGCYKDKDANDVNILSHLYVSYAMTKEMCLRYCYQSGFSFGGLEDAVECRCGNDEPSTNQKTDETECNEKCLSSGGDNQMCGGESRISVFDLRYENDVDECSTGAHNCHENARCDNVDNGFMCKCKDGFEGDGVTCSEIVVVTTTSSTPTPALTSCQQGVKDCDPGEDAPETLYICKYIPQCDNEGQWKPEQLGASGETWCVDQAGNEIAGSMLGPGENRETPCSEPVLTSCQQALEDSKKDCSVIPGFGCIPMTGAKVPQCDDEGNWEPEQFWGSTGSSWCVDKDGNEIEGTHIGPGQQREKPCSELEQTTPTEKPDVECSDSDKTPQEQLEKFNFRFGKYRALWLTDKYPNFSDKMQRKLETLANKMITKFNKAPVSGCEEESELERFDQEDPCKGASQIIAGYKKWGRKFIKDDKFNNRIGQQFDNKKSKIHQKLNC